MRVACSVLRGRGCSNAPSLPGIVDADFGAGFIKIATYFPYPLKVWANGHEWAKRRAEDEGLAYTELRNGFAACEDPARLQVICDELSPTQIQRFFDRWILVILRQAFTGEGQGPGMGLYFGATSGDVFGSGDAGASWFTVRERLAPVNSVRAA